MNDLLHEKNLSFYRGTQTADALKEVDIQLEQLIQLLSPHLLLAPTHKIVEYLIRVYDVHAHAKHSFIMAFLPYFETAYFMKAI